MFVHMKNFTLSLVLLVSITSVQIVMLANAQSASGDNDTNVDPDTTPALCHVPAHSNLSRVLQDPNEEEIKIEGRCYLACTELENVSS